MKSTFKKLLSVEELLKMSTTLIVCLEQTTSWGYLSFDCCPVTLMIDFRLTESVQVTIVAILFVVDKSIVF